MQEHYRLFARTALLNVEGKPSDFVVHDYFLQTRVTF